MIYLEKSDIFKVIASLIHAELKKIRKTSDSILPIFSLTEQTPIMSGGFEADSIELLTLAGSVNRMFHLSESGVEDYLLRYRTLGEWAEIVHQGMSRNHISFMTSATTGEAKICTHEWACIEQEIAEHANIFRHSQRIVATAPAHHIYGFLFTILLPRYMNLPVHDQVSNMPMFLEKKLEPGDLVVSFPVYWKYIDDTISRFPQNIYGLTSTEACDMNIIRSLLKKGLHSMTEIYGSSETGGIGIRHHYENPYQLFSFWKKDSDTTLKRELSDGKLSGAIILSDELEWENESCFRVLRRIDGAVHIAGINVFPDVVAEKIRSHAWIKECCVRPSGLKNNLRLEAYIKLAQGISSTKETQDAVRKWLYENLSASERPICIFTP